LKATGVGDNVGECRVRVDKGPSATPGTPDGNHLGRDARVIARRIRPGRPL